MCKPKIFLSYASEDRDTVKQIYEFLQSNNCDPWLDVEKLLPGQNWENEIEVAIEESDFFVMCLSSKSVEKRGYVQAEYLKGLDWSRRIPEGDVFLIPVRLDSCRPARAVSKLHWLDWFEESGRNRLLKTIDVYFRKSSENVSVTTSFDWISHDGVARPFVPVQVYQSEDEEAVSVNALVDSGADLSVFDAQIKDQLKPHAYSYVQIEGVGGTKQVRMDYVYLRIDPLPSPVLSPVVFQEGLKENILGRAGSSEYVNITLDSGNKKTIVELNKISDTVARPNTT